MEQLPTVQPDVAEGQFRVELTEILVGEVFEDEAGGAEMRATDNVDCPDDVGMAQLFHNLVFSLDLGRLDGQQYFHDDILLGFEVAPLEYVRVATAADLVGDGVVFHIAPGQLDRVVERVLNVLPLDVDRTVGMH